MFEFYWRVPEDGFEWVAARSVGTESDSGIGPTGEAMDYLCQRGVEGRSNVALNCRTYSPLENGALFKTFAGTEQTRQGVLAFANQYGALGGLASTLVARPARADDEKNSYYCVYAESLDTWIKEIRVLNHAIQLWEALKRKDVAFLSELIHWSRDSTDKQETTAYNFPEYSLTRVGVAFLSEPIYWSKGSSETREAAVYHGPQFSVGGISNAALNIRPEIRSLFVPGDVIYPGWFALHEIINQNLEFHQATPRLLWQQDHGKFTRIIQIVPGSLIASFWIQLAKAVEGNREHQQCEECRKWFEVSGDRRGDARFCSDPCRFRAYRKRQKEALRLHATGTPPKDIAKQLGSDAKTVKGWISKGKRDVKTKAR
jgi:hypothetical protein